jgi:hypothetical protein
MLAHPKQTELHLKNQNCSARNGEGSRRNRASGFSRAKGGRNHHGQGTFMVSLNCWETDLYDGVQISAASLFDTQQTTIEHQDFRQEHD